MVQVHKLRKWLQLLLVLIALHSASVGFCLFVLPTNWLSFFGFVNYSGRFFQMQGGVFHAVICVAYLLAGINPDRFRRFVYFTIYTKGCATFFLITYYIFVESVWMVLFSGLIDAVMCGAVAYLVMLYSKAIATAKAALGDDAAQS